MNTPQKKIEFEVPPQAYAKLAMIAAREGKSLELCLLEMLSMEKAKVELAAVMALP